jgi:hypothetical protein
VYIHILTENVQEHQQKQQQNIFLHLNVMFMKDGHHNDIWDIGVIAPFILNLCVMLW